MRLQLLKLLRETLGEFLEIELDIEGYDASEFNETQIEITA